MDRNTPIRERIIPPVKSVSELRKDCTKDLRK